MKRTALSRCAAQLLPAPSPRPSCLFAQRCLAARRLAAHTHARLQSTASLSTDGELHVNLPADLPADLPTDLPAAPAAPAPPSRKPQARWPTPLEKLPSPHPSAADRSRFPLQTLARTLVHPSADPSPAFNNAALSLLGRHLLGYYTTEWLLCNYPRLPMAVVFAAVDAYVGPKALATVASEWGIEAAAEPGGEVDPGLLQFKRIQSGGPLPASMRRHAPWSWNVTTTHRITHTDEFGSDTAAPSPHALKSTPVPLEEAAQSFVRALVGSLHLHLGAPFVKRFFRGHITSRHLDLSTLFDFRTPTRDLSKLCAREGFESPVARLISETGRLSRHPVFVVGVYSGKDKLGEGAGSSLDEARARAAAAALKAWYLYRPVDVTVPSSTEGVLDASNWRPNMVDCGEVIV
ncbi:ribonuclease III [Lizonia empirigonia]|nr:ribonuclease III [Lizonia empirigonia]